MSYLRTGSRRFRVETRLDRRGWEECWTDRGAPSRFSSYRAAEDALDLFLREVESTTLDGDMLEAYDRDDFRITEVRP